MSKKDGYEEKRKKTSVPVSNTHHIVPLSREGPDATWNEYTILVKKHDAWNDLFHNFLPSTCIAIIQSWTDEQGQLDIYKMGRNHLKSWIKFFGDGGPQQAIEFIRDNFLPAELRFLEEIKKAGAKR